LWGQNQRQIDLEANVQGLLSGGGSQLLPQFSHGEPFPLENAFDFARKLQVEPIEWLTTTTGREMLGKATPKTWPRIDGDDTLKLRKFTLEYLVDGSLALALTRDPEAGAKFWLGLPLANRLSICRLVQYEKSRFRNLGFCHRPLQNAPLVATSKCTTLGTFGI
jgi:hypothetical protein